MKYTCNRYFGDIYGRTATVTVDRKLSRMPYAQAGIIIRDNSVILVSYDTVAADITDGKLTVSCLISNTTRRHVSRFLEEYCPAVSYALAKKAFNKGLSVDIATLELVPTC